MIPETGHWVAEQAPGQVLAALSPFLEPYRSAGRSPLSGTSRAGDDDHVWDVRSGEQSRSAPVGAPVFTKVGITWR